MRQALAEVRGRLGEGGASRRAAGEVAAMLDGIGRSAEGRSGVAA